MNKRQKLVLQQYLNDEEALIKALEMLYGDSLKDINRKVLDLDSSISVLQRAYDSIGTEIGDLALSVLGSKAKYMTPAEAEETIKSMLQSKVYQKKYQEALKKQISAIFDKMGEKQFATISEYLKECYENGFIGTLYDLQGQDIPLCFPFDQEQIVRAVQLDSKISKGLYSRLGEDVSLLKKKIAAEISRGISTGMSYQQMARQLASVSNTGYNNAVRIARTEGHRIQCQAGMDACYKAKEKGADVAKRWDATLDGRTRESHVAVDGEIRELDEPFSNGLMFPGDPRGGAAEVINCRCALLQKGKAFLTAEETKYLGDVSKMSDKQKEQLAKRLKVPVDELEQYSNQIIPIRAKDYDDFKRQYKNIWNYESSDLKKDVDERLSKLKSQKNSKKSLTNTVKNGKIEPEKSSVVIGGENITIAEGEFGFEDGYGGVLKTVDAVTYTTTEGTQFVFPKTYDTAHQSMTPEQAISAWQRVPQSIREQAQKTVEFVDYYNPADAYWRKVYQNFPQSYATGGDKITFYRWDYAHDMDYVIRTYCHEAGHYIDTSLATSARRFSDETLWAKAMADDLLMSAKKSCTVYGENNACEDFAESIAEYVKDKAAFTKKFPNRAEILDGIIK